ncbi:MAG: hypothetical protein EGR70_05600 [[Ruminococcus] faecis]|nr:hypothetical protein [Mediterraneibacter faecis]
MKKELIDKTYKIKTERFSFLKKFSFHWLSLYLPVKSDILKDSQSLKNLIFIRTKTKEKKNEYI